MKIAIAGYGREGLSSARYWAEQGHEITILDRNQELKSDDFPLILGPNYLNNLQDYDLVSRSAGLHPSLLKESKKVTSNTNQFLRVCPTKHIIGVTGTKGKGTTSSLIHQMLIEAGFKSHLGGNIGLPPLELLREDITKGDVVVLEMSSFQLMDLQTSPSIGVCLLVEPEHQDWHGSVDEYVGAKQQLFAHQAESDTAIYYPESELSIKVASVSPGRHVPYFRPPGAIVKDDHIEIDGNAICLLSDIALIGQHNWQNVCAAVTAVWQLTQNQEAIKKAIINFRGLPFRLEDRGVVGDVHYFNDSFSSQPEAAIAAIAAISQPKVIILGGFDRGLDLSRLATAVAENQSHIRKVIVIGASGPRLIEAFTKVGFNNYLRLESNSMEEIVSSAKQQALPGDAVVLSPGFASFDMFANFEDRGIKFNQAVAKL